MLLNKTINKHQPVLLDEIKAFIPAEKEINVIDATFGGGGYSRSILQDFNVNQLIAIDRDPISKIFSRELEKKYLGKFNLINGCFSQIDKLVNLNHTKKNINKFDIIIFDLGLSSNQLEDPQRGFSFLKEGPLNMNMGMSKSNLLASDIINNFSENKIADIIFKYGEERNAKKIARSIIKCRKLKIIKTTLELAKLITRSIPNLRSKKNKTNPATKTFQALRIYINDELNELKLALNKSHNLLSPKGKLMIVSFQSLEDKIVKDFFNHKSGKRWRSSRHYPELPDNGQITLKIITKKPIRPNDSEILNNPRSRSAKLRVGEKIN